jgi:hypothetical protein
LQEPFHPLIRFAGGKDDRISRINDSIIGAWLLSIVHAWLHIPLHTGASRQSSTHDHVHMIRAWDEGVPPFGFIMRCVVMVLSRLGIEFPRSVVVLRSTKDMMPDVAALRDGPAFLHELMTIPPPPTSAAGDLDDCGPGRRDSRRVGFDETGNGNPGPPRFESAALVRTGRLNHRAARRALPIACVADRALLEGSIRGLPVMILTGKSHCLT